MGIEPFYGKGPYKLLWAGSRAASVKTTVTCKPNCTSDCEIILVYAHFTNVSASRTMQPGGPIVGDPSSGLTLNSKTAKTQVIKNIRLLNNLT